MIKTYSTFAGARRAHPGKPILRVLVDGVEDLFMPVSFNTDIYAVNPQTGSADGHIKFIDLSARPDQR